MEPKTRKRRTTKPKNAEITAMTEIIRILEPLSQNAKNRTLGWVADWVMDTVRVSDMDMSFNVTTAKLQEANRCITGDALTAMGKVNALAINELVTTEYQGAD